MLIDRAAPALSGARTSAEILEARDQADVIYDMAKKAARLAKAKGAHDTLLAAANRFATVVPQATELYTVRLGLYGP
jgi:hypothetical protein